MEEIRFIHHLKYNSLKHLILNIEVIQKNGKSSITAAFELLRALPRALTDHHALATGPMKTLFVLVFSTTARWNHRSAQVLTFLLPSGTHLPLYILYM